MQKVKNGLWLLVLVGMVAVASRAGRKKPSEFERMVRRYEREHGYSDN